MSVSLISEDWTVTAVSEAPGLLPIMSVMSTVNCRKRIKNTQLTVSRGVSKQLDYITLWPCGSRCVWKVTFGAFLVRPGQARGLL